MSARLLIFLILGVAVVCISGCSKLQQRTATGFAQGTTYTIHYITEGPDLQYKIDSILAAFDRVLSTYQQTSYISKWNRNQSSGPQPKWFSDLAKRSIELSANTNGAFDITIGPITTYFGFGAGKGESKIDSSTVDSLRQFVGYKLLRIDGNDVTKTDPRLQLDVNAVAQGYSVDVIAHMFEAAGINGHLVEIGGEVRAKGQKLNGDWWQVGIDEPTADGNPDRNLATSIELKNRSMATSGNYRKAKEIDGKLFGHTFDPRTGYPVSTDVLSATIFAPDATTADALATACMVMGFDPCKSMVTTDTTLDAMLIYQTGQGVEVWRSF